MFLQQHFLFFRATETISVKPFARRVSETEFKALTRQSNYQTIFKQTQFVYIENANFLSQQAVLNCILFYTKKLGKDSQT